MIIYGTNMICLAQFSSFLLFIVLLSFFILPWSLFLDPSERKSCIYWRQKKSINILRKVPFQYIYREQQRKRHRMTYTLRVDWAAPSTHRVSQWILMKTSEYIYNINRKRRILIHIRHKDDDTSSTITHYCYPMKKHIYGITILNSSNRIRSKYWAWAPFVSNILDCTYVHIHK